MYCCCATKMDLNSFSYYSENSKLNCSLKLEDEELWKKFDKHQTEMIITKSGRRMFPSLRVIVEGLDPLAQYCVFLEMVHVSDKRYKFCSEWVSAGTCDPQSPHRLYMHPHSPSTGYSWMSLPIAFSKLKLTNTAIPHRGQVVLSSMHKYQPRIIIVQAADPRAKPWAPGAAFFFKETQFIAVTAYQNEEVTKLKIDNNPFAKGFRENGAARVKRKRSLHDADLEPKREPKQPLASPLDSTASCSSSPSSSPGMPETHYPLAAGPGLVFDGPNALHSPSAPHGHLQPYFLPHFMPSSPAFPPFAMAHMYYQPMYAAPRDYVTTMPQDLSAVRKPKRLKDFSIRAIMGSP